jgi:FkbH-like protein
MMDLKYAEILARNRELGAALKDVRPYRIALLSNIVVAQMRELLEFSLRRNGIHAQVTLGEYDNVVQDAKRFDDVDAIVVFWEPANLIDGLHVKVESLSTEGLEDLATRVEGEINLVLNSLRAVPLVLFNRFSTLLFCGDELRESAFSRLSRRLDLALMRDLPRNVLPIDMTKIIADVGLNAVADHRQYQSSRALYSLDFLRTYAEHVEPAFIAASGRARKVLVVDCDNTLWGGILGEDGEDGIRLSDATREGKVYREVQFLLKGMQTRGVLLAICSKNNFEDVDRVLKNHPDMVLREEDFVASRVNWKDKAGNLRELAEELNVGLESFVFLDDSEFELGQVAGELPQVLCVRVPTALSEYPPVVRRLQRAFFMLSTSDEDNRKTDMYRQEATRRQDAASYASVDDYLRSLGLQVRVSWGTGVPRARAAQMSQKTNQFNLTTRRYTEGDIEGMVQDPGWLVTTWAVRDRHGDYGVTALVIVRLSAAIGEATLDTWLMSCRVLGRKVELAIADHLMMELAARGVTQVNGEYIPTQKNAQVADFLDVLGFQPQKSTAGVSQMYSLALSSYRPQRIDFIEVIQDVC